MRSRDKWVMLLATGGYLGKIPVAPGTFGTLAGLPVCYLLAKMGWAPVLACLALLVAVAVAIADAAEKALEKKDPGCIVIDEIAGMAVTLAWLPFTLNTAVAGFVLFRVLDILKPPPVRQLDRGLTGGFGVVMDDVAAGVMANLLLRAGMAWWGAG
jgi:phosphatidylglycerophosphatase A